MQSLIILGRQPKIGLAELESLYGAGKLRPVGEQAAVLDIEPVNINFARLGGMVKFAKVLTTLDTVKWGKIQEFLESNVPLHLSYLPEGKLRFGLSAYGLDVSPKRLQATGLSLKKVIRGAGRSTRYVPNVEPALNAAQVLHNQLTQKLGWELIFVKDGPGTIVAQSIAVQDIDAYRRRDQERPFRDARVGMLPPKLAQIIINLAVGGNSPAHGAEVTDPFCGTGVILQEASLMGFGLAGSDLEPRMIEYTDKNLQWLAQVNPNLITHSQDGRYYKLKIADAAQDNLYTGNFIASETYLGRPLSSPPDAGTLQKIISDVDTIHKKFLQNVTRQTKPGFRLCLALPAWRTKNDFRHLPMLDSLGGLGYNRIKFVHATNEDLIYHRESQVVARELVVLTRK